MYILESGIYFALQKYFTIANINLPTDNFIQALTPNPCMTGILIFERYFILFNLQKYYV